MKALLQYKRLLSGALLFLILAVSVPKELYHDCGHRDQSHQEDSRSGFSAGPECAICDFHLLPHYVPSEVFGALNELPSTDYTYNHIEAHHSRLFWHFTLRGPPGSFA